MSNPDSDLYYTYELAYPDDTVFYVGKGKGNRIDAHIKEALSGHQCGKCAIIRRIHAQGEQVKLCKVYRTPIEDNAFLHEWIRVNLIHDHTQLININEGGKLRQHHLYKAVRFMLSDEIIHALPCSLTKAIHFVIATELDAVNAIDRISNHPLLPQMLTLKPRNGYCVQLPLDFCTRLDLIPRRIHGMRSAAIEFLLRTNFDLLSS